MRMSLPAIALLLLSALPVSAEGARTVFTCTGLTKCNAGGTCAPDDMTTSFTFAPVQTDADGAGTYSVDHDGTAATGTGAPLGPFVWSEGAADRQTLLVTAETGALWQSLDTSAGTSIIRFLSCEVIR